MEEACQIEDAKARMPTSQDKTVLAIHWKSKPAKQSMSIIDIDANKMQLTGSGLILVLWSLKNIMCVLLVTGALT